MTRLRTVLEFSESNNSEGRVTESQAVLEYSELSDSGIVTRLRNVLECSELINTLSRVTR